MQIYNTEDFRTENFLWGKYNPEYIKVENPIFIPLKRIPGEKTHIGGMVDNEGNVIPKANVWRERGPSKSPKNIISLDNTPITKTPQTQIKGDYTYLGGLFNQYGHFLLESLARIPLNQENRTSTICFGLYHKPVSYIEYILNTLKIKPVFIDKITQVNGTITIPHPRVVIGSYFDSSQNKIYEEILNHALQNTMPAKKVYPQFIYMSRSKVLRNKRKILNEIEIERHLSRRGFTIYHMQDISFEEQVLLMHNAKVVIGFAGSAMHSLVFCNDSVRSIFLYKDEFILPNYISQDYMLDRSSLYIDISEITRNGKVNIKLLMNTIDEII